MPFAHALGNSFLAVGFPKTLKSLKPSSVRAGGGQGIGRAFAHALGEAGAAVAVVDVVRATAEATAAELAGKGIRSVAVVADITRAKDCERCGAAVMTFYR